jgi:hypothetical protein
MGFVLFGLPPLRRTVGVSRRAPHAQQRPQFLSEDERSAIRLLADRKSLRSLAADFDVSHEMVRRVIRDADAAVA